MQVGEIMHSDVKTANAEDTFAEVAKSSCDRLVSLGRYVLRGVRRPQELFTLVPVDGPEGGSEQNRSRLNQSDP